MKFLIDAQLPPRLAHKLVEAGHDARHVYDVLAADVSDIAIAEEANATQSILLSKDEDFLDLSIRGVLTVPFVWIRTGNMTTSQVWATLEPMLASIEQAVGNRERVIEIA